MKHRTIFRILLLSAVATLSACDVEQTDEGEMPDVDVSVEEGNMPEYDVDTADVSVDSQEKEVEVPHVEVESETETVTVPDVEVDMPEDDRTEK